MAPPSAFGLLYYQFFTSERAEDYQHITLSRNRLYPDRVRVTSANYKRDLKSFRGTINNQSIISYPLTLIY